VKTAFGHLVVVEVPVAVALHPEEAALAATWGDKRKATFTAGRHALRQALQGAGVDVDGGTLRDLRGAPVLPLLPGGGRVCGSVTHKDTVAAALVSTSAVVGVDLELLEMRDRKSVDRLIAQTLTAREAAALPDDDDGRCRALLLRFSLKEALYKALDPFVQRYVPFQEVEVDVDGAAAVFTVPGFCAEGAVVDVGRPGVLLTVARCRRA
jgi:4'-phosphopantetheinyl transferase EntD